MILQKIDGNLDQPGTEHPVGLTHSPREILSLICPSSYSELGVPTLLICRTVITQTGYNNTGALQRKHRSKDHGKLRNFFKLQAIRESSHPQNAIRNYSGLVKGSGSQMEQWALSSSRVLYMHHS